MVICLSTCPLNFLLKNKVWGAWRLGTVLGQRTQDRRVRTCLGEGHASLGDDPTTGAKHIPTAAQELTSTQNQNMPSHVLGQVEKASTNTFLMSLKHKETYENNFHVIHIFPPLLHWKVYTVHSHLLLTEKELILFWNSIQSNSGWNKFLSCVEMELIKIPRLFYEGKKFFQLLATFTT